MSAAEKEEIEDNKIHLRFPNQQELLPETFVKCVKGIHSIPALVQGKPHHRGVFVKFFEHFKDDLWIMKDISHQIAVDDVTVIVAPKEIHLSAKCTAFQFQL